MVIQNHMEVWLSFDGVGESCVRSWKGSADEVSSQNLEVAGVWR